MRQPDVPAGIKVFLFIIFFLGFGLCLLVILDAEVWHVLIRPAVHNQVDDSAQLNGVGEDDSKHANDNRTGIRGVCLAGNSPSVRSGCSAGNACIVFCGISGAKFVFKDHVGTKLQVSSQGLLSDRKQTEARPVHAC
jgi:hypothetical protein